MNKYIWKKFAWTLVAATTVALAACNGGSDTTLGSSSSGGSGGTGGGTSGSSKYSVQIRRTAFGIPHIQGKDYASIGYGLGYAFAEDNLCVMMDDFVTIRAQRAQYFGRAGTYTIPANGSSVGNVDSDFFWKMILTPEAIGKFRDAAAVDARAATIGYKDGFNRYLREIKAGQHAGRHLACRNGAWLIELTEDDMYRRYIRLGVLAGSSALTGYIATAAPPAALVPAVAKRQQRNRTPRQIVAGVDRSKLPLAKPLPIGSNMYALGSQATQSGIPMVFGNPHFPWTGTERLYISHLTIPGKADIEGSSLYGVPAILIGFNRHFAWSHTVSTAYRFTFYELTLNPANPTQYMYDGAMRDMTAVPMTIQVKEADGSMTTESRTLYKSHYGPMLVLSASGVPILGWNNLKAYTIRDANYENTRLINQFFAWNKAQSFDEFKSLQKSILGVPWVNTIGSAPGAKAYYADITVVPNVSDAKVTSCAAHPIHDAVQLLLPGLPVLDGSKSSCEWDTDVDAPAPGIFGPSHLPSLERDDWVANNNDSYWLTNPAQPITGYAHIIGDEGTERSLRTRLSILQVQRRLAGTDGRAGTKFTQQNLEDVVLSSHIYSAELARDSVVNNLCPLGTLLGTGGPVDVSAACTVIKNWDLSDNLDSVGGHIWREFWSRLTANPLGLPLGVPLPVNINWLTQFSTSDPVNTPNTLNVLNPLVQAAFADGVAAVQASGIPLDKPFGDIQHSGIHNTRIPIFGGLHGEGAFTVVSTNGIDSDGYRVTYGNSYIQAVTWDSAGNPVADGFITYSESTDPANPHYNDYTQAYSAKQWNHLPFTDAQITAQQQGATVNLSE